MNTITFDINNGRNIFELIKNSNLKKGDTIKFISNKTISDDGLMLLFTEAALAMIFYSDKKEQQKTSENLLASLFKDFENPTDLENHIEKEYGVRIEVEESNDEREFWSAIGLQGLSRAYDDGEADYSDVPLMEKNPNYKK